MNCARPSTESLDLPNPWQTVQPEVHLRPNKAASYAVFANVLASSKRIGLTKIAVVGSEQFVQ